ncbi:MAG: hypothetical protein R6U89_06495 [Dehalococcoidia bacterium]
MITTVTTATTTITIAHFAAMAGIIAIAALIIFLIAKELIGSAATDTEDEGSKWGGRAKMLTERINIAIYALLFVFAAIVVTQVITILR